MARLTLLVGLSGCSPDFDELSRGQTAVDSVTAGGAGAESAGVSNASGGGDGGAAASGAQPDTHGGAPSSAGNASVAGAASSAGIGPIANGGEASGGDGGVVADSGSAGAGTGGDAVGGSAGAGTGGTSNMPQSPSASASTEEFSNGNPANNAFDGSSLTKWCASDGSSPQWWQLDLQVMTSFSGFSIEFESPEAYPYQLQVSSDGSHFSVVLDQTTNTNASQTQGATVDAHGRYLRVYFPSLPPPDPWPHWACLREFRLLEAVPDPTDTSAGPAGGASAGGG